MIENLPFWIPVLFLVIWAVTICLFHFSNGKPNRWTFLLIGWSLLHSVLAFNGFYENTTAFPPRFALVLLPAFLLIGASLLPKNRDAIIRNRNIHVSTVLHTIRFPVELVLFQLFVYQMIPKLMTFEGRNFDIIMGITAPIVGYLWFKGKINKRLLLIWNVVGLCLVSFILFNGLLSAELPFQQFGFDQPNRAVMYYPFVLLPATIVPIVLWTHLTDILLLSSKPS